MKDENFHNGLDNHIKSLSIEEIVKDLPGMLKQPCNHLVEETEKEVFLIGAIGIISGLLPNLKGLYAGKWIAPNLFVYILAAYGGGKGGLDYARELGNQIHKAKREKAKKMMLEYLTEMEVYKKELKAYNRNKIAEPPTKPVKAPTLMLYIPANNSKSGIYQLLEENDDKGIMFESEGDTLADAIKQDYGSFSDTLRKAFHHENLDLFRRGNEELIEINKPELSVVLSSTFNQLKILIPSIEDGLYSRFIFYELKQDNKFNDVFDDRKSNYQQFFIQEGEIFKKLFDEFEELETPILFKLTKKQEKEFVEILNIKKANLMKEVDVTMAGTANRLGIIAFRIMMIFTALRTYENGTLNNSITCNDTDFYNALRIIDRLEKHAKTVYDYLNGEPDKKKLAFQLKENGTSIRDIEKVVKIGRGTLSKWFNK
jgi:hypothetical protein